MKANSATMGGLSLRDLEYAVAIVDEGNFIRAAEKCNVSQPSLSIQVRKLEETLGVPLFERTTRRVLVTKAGMPFITQARRVLTEAKALMSLSTSEVDPLLGTLHLSAISTLGPYFFPRVLPDLRKMFPSVALVLAEGLTADLLSKLENGDVDAIIASLPLEANWIQNYPLFREPFMMASPRLEGDDENGLSWEAMPPERRLLMEEGHCLRQQALEACGFSDRSRRHGTSLETLKYMVAAGEGSTLVPQLAVSLADPVKYSALPADVYSRTIALAWRRSDHRAEHFVKLGRSLSTIALDLNMALQAV